VGSWRTVGAELIGRAFDTALLLPNSMHAALIAARAGIPERWGYGNALRRRLLTRAVARPGAVHQVDYYQRLVAALGFATHSREPRIQVTAAARDAGARMLRDAGWQGRPLVALAPGAAYGGAKRWPAAAFAALAATLAADGVECVIVGSSADAETAADVGREYSQSARHNPGRAEAGVRNQLIDVTGRTDLSTLAGLLTHCRALVTNDSGAMHLAAAAGIPVTAVFGPTDERATRPVGDAHVVITHPVWCRPCMLRECPIDHRCMRDIRVDAVVDAARRTL
jgi:heptosyltransferase-2